MIVGGGHVPEWRRVGPDRARSISRWSAVVSSVYAIVAVATAVVTIVAWREIPRGNPTTPFCLMGNLATAGFLLVNVLGFLALRRSVAGDCLDMIRIRSVRRVQVVSFPFTFVFGMLLSFVTVPNGYEPYAYLTVPPMVLMLAGMVALFAAARRQPPSR